MGLPSDDTSWAQLISFAESIQPSEPSSFQSPDPSSPGFARLFDHTLLKTDATGLQIDKLCEEARRYHFKTVCVRLEWVARAAANLKGTNVVVCCVVGFPEGTAATAAKVQEAFAALEAGATELDMVLKVPALREGDYTSVYADIMAVRQACSRDSMSKSKSTNGEPAELILKVILETSQLSTNQIIAGALIARAAGADFVKTSTGFLGRGATAEDVRIMREMARIPWEKLGAEGIEEGKVVKVKASGGVRTLEDAIKMVEAGAERIGASAGLSIVEEALSRK